MENYINASDAAEELNLTDDEFLYILRTNKEKLPVEYIYDLKTMQEMSINGEFDNFFRKRLYIKESTLSIILDFDYLEESQLLKIKCSDFINFKTIFNKDMIDLKYMNMFIEYCIKEYAGEDKNKEYILNNCKNPRSTYHTILKYKDKYNKYNDINTKKIIQDLLEKFKNIYGNFLNIETSIGKQGSNKDYKRIEETAKVCELANSTIASFEPNSIRLTYDIYRKSIESKCCRGVHIGTVKKYWDEIDKSYKNSGRPNLEDKNKPEFKL